MMSEFVTNLLPLLMVTYLCVGVIVASCLSMYFIAKDDFTREHIAQSTEAIVFYGPVAVYYTVKGLVWLIKYAWTRPYREWWKVVGQTIQGAWRTAAASRKFDKALKESRKK